jgi:hypothetical protein
MIKQATVNAPDTTTDEPKLAEHDSLKLGTKRDVASMFQLSPRTIDGLMAAGMPHCKLGLRRCRFDLPAVRQWFIDQYGVQRIGKAGNVGGGK